MQSGDYSDTKMGSIPIDIDRPTPAQKVNWGDPSAPQAKENSKKELKRHGGMDAIERRISKQRS